MSWEPSRGPAAMRPVLGAAIRGVPLVALVRGYRRSDLVPDLAAGITVAALMVPSGLAYGALAGLSPVSGLYTGVLAMLGYAVFSSSRVQIVGPESQTAILVAAALAPLAAAGTPEYAALAATMALLAGALCLLAAALRLGFLADYLSQPVLVGYLTGVALVVLVGQAGKLLGSSAAGDTLVELVGDFLARLDDVDLPSTLVGVLTACAVLALRRWAPRVPAPLVAVVVATAVSAWADLARRGVAVVGAVQPGLPLPSVPDVTPAEVLRLLGPTAGLVVIVFADTVLTARAYALRRNDAPVSGNRELLALGTANLGSGLFSGFAVGASDSRTAVNHATGGRTQAVGLVAAALTVVFLVLLTPLVADLPQPALAAVVLVAASALLRPRDFARLWRLRRFEFWLAVVALAGVAVLGILPGILLAAGVNLLELVWRLSRPRVDRLGRPASGGRWRRVRGDERDTVPGLLVLRIGGPLFYGNAEFVLARVRRQLRVHGDRPRWVVLDCSAVSLTDSNGIGVFSQVLHVAGQRGTDIGLARVSTALEDDLRAAGVWPDVADRAFDRVEDAVAAFHRAARGDGAPPVAHDG